MIDRLFAFESTRRRQRAVRQRYASEGKRRSSWWRNVLCDVSGKRHYGAPRAQWRTASVRGVEKNEDWIAGIDFSDAAAAVACVAKEFDGWAPELTALITEGETDPVPRRSRSNTDGTVYPA